MRFSIGEFSRITTLSVKTLRLYHEKGILEPARVDPDSGYRYYDDECVHRARGIRMLREFDFSIAEIRDLLEQCDDERDLLGQLEAKLQEVERTIKRYRGISRSIATLIEQTRETDMDQPQEFEIEEKELETMLIAGHRMTGRYGEVGKGLGLVCRKMGRQICGKPMTLYHDAEYKEEDADFEPCVPVRKGKDAEGISVRELPGGRCVSLIHKGPYEGIGASYRLVFGYINEKGYTARVPSREVYLKGPGMIFKGNPKNYLTEIQVLIDTE
jgi:DNA-binding transcriptional MerR regulator